MLMTSATVNLPALPVPLFLPLFSCCVAAKVGVRNVGRYAFVFPQ